MSKSVIILASGKGSNAERIIDHFSGDERVCIDHVISNRKSAGVLLVAESKEVKHSVIEKEAVNNGALLSFLVDQEPDLIVLAGYLLKIPEAVVREFPEKVVNLHPSLLPKYGGKGMFGQHVIKAVIDNRETETGITIHLVNEEYDKGRILYQHQCPIEVDDTVETLSKKIQALEHKYFPLVIDDLLK